MNLINFVYSSKDKTTKPTFYSHIDPIKKFLPPDLVSETDCVNKLGAINLWITISRRINKIDYYLVEKNDEGHNIRRLTQNDIYRVAGNLHKVKTVFMSHGIADKHYRDFNSIKDFDYVCTSGPAWTKKYIRQGVRRSRILEIGYPKLDSIFNGDLQPSPREDDRIRVLWAPTHGGGNSDCSSYPECDEIVKKFPSKFKAWVSSHPRHKEDKGVTLQDLLDCDVVISDTGSLVYEAWIVGKPVVFPTYLVTKGVGRRYGKDRHNFEHHIYIKPRYGYHSGSFEELVENIYRAAEKGMGEREREFIEGIFPEKYRGKSGQRVAEALMSIDESRSLYSIGKSSRYYATLRQSGMGVDINGVYFFRNRETPVSYGLYKKLSKDPNFHTREEVEDVRSSGD